jgi:hypothetical protein
MAPVYNPAFGGWGQENYESKASLGYIVRDPVSKKTPKTTTKKPKNQTKQK